MLHGFRFNRNFFYNFNCQLEVNDVFVDEFDDDVEYEVEYEVDYELSRYGRT